MTDEALTLSSVQMDKLGGADQLLPLVYEELRKLAAFRMAGEDPGQTLQATALVHEAWLKLSGPNRQEWRGRGHFFGAAAEAMRRILIDKARRKGSLKRGGGQRLEDLEGVAASCVAMTAPTAEILAVHDALDALAAEDSIAAEVVKMRYFMGMTIPETAEVLEISPRSADRHWSFAKAWLRQAIPRN